MTVGANIKRIRKEKGLTQKKLGELCGIAESNIRKYENGKQNPKIETIERIANALGESAMRLLPIEKYKQTEEFKQVMREVDTSSACIKILEELYNRAEHVSVDAYNKGILQYSSDYISLGIEPNKLSISNDYFYKICEQTKHLLKTTVELVAENEDDMLAEWLNEDGIDELQTSEPEHAIIRYIDNKQNKKYTKPPEPPQE